VDTEVTVTLRTRYDVWVMLPVLIVVLPLYLREAWIGVRTGWRGYD
jgi:hypothetical protein